MPRKQPKVQKYVAVCACLLPQPRSGVSHRDRSSGSPTTSTRPNDSESDASSQAHLFKQLETVRRKWDAAAPRWVPHITLIPPFVVPDEVQVKHEVGSLTQEGAGERSRDQDPHEAASSILRTISQRIADALSEVQPHTVRLDDMGSFKLRKYWNVHLRPHSKDPSQPGPTTTNNGRDEFIAMQDVLARALPDLVTDERPFSPHASLGQARTKEELEELMRLGRGLTGQADEAIEDSAEPKRCLECSVSEVTLLAKPQGKPGPYDVWATIDIGLGRGGEGGSERPE